MWSTFLRLEAALAGAGLGMLPVSATDARESPWRRSNREANKARSTFKVVLRATACIEGSDRPPRRSARASPAAADEILLRRPCRAPLPARLRSIQGSGATGRDSREDGCRPARARGASPLADGPRRLGGGPARMGRVARPGRARPAPGRA